MVEWTRQSLISTDKKYPASMVIKTNNHNHSLTRLTALTALTALLAVASLAGIVPEVSAWNVFVAPSSQQVQPGASTTFQVSVALEQPEYCIDCPTITLQALQSIPYGSVGFSTDHYTFSYQHYTFESTMTVNTGSLTPPGTYPITVTAISANPSGQKSTTVNLIVAGAAPSQYQTLTTNVSPPGSGSVTPNCPSGCQIVVGSVGDIVATPAPGWAFSSWTITGATCPTGPTTNPCKALTMPNNPVSITATFTTTGPTAPPFDFALSVSPSAASVNQGDTAHFAVGVMYSDPSYAGTMINIQLAGLGPGMNYALSPNGDLTITTSQTTPAGSYAISLTGSANGVMHQTGVTLIVTSAQAATAAVTSTAASSTSTSSAAFDYSVTVSPSTQSVEIGASTTYVVSVLPLAGSPVPVSLTVMGCPGDVHSSFTTQSATPPYTSTLNLDLSTSSANAGAYTLTVVATAGGNVKTATATLMIKEKAAQTQTTVAQTATSGSSLSDVLQQNSLIIIAALLAIVVVLGVLAMRGRGRRAVAQQMGPSRTCGKCGAQNPASNEFCRSCGNRLKGS